MSGLAFPYGVDRRGRSASPTDAEQVLQFVELILFTSPGERVHRPEFGAAVRQLVFAPASAELAAATQYRVQGALQKYLGDRAQLNEVKVSAEENRITIEVVFTPTHGDAPTRVTFDREV